MRLLTFPPNRSKLHDFTYWMKVQVKKTNDTITGNQDSKGRTITPATQLSFSLPKSTSVSLQLPLWILHVSAGPDGGL